MDSNRPDHYRNNISCVKSLVKCIAPYNFIVVCALILTSCGGDDSQSTPPITRELVQVSTAASGNIVSNSTNTLNYNKSILAGELNGLDKIIYVNLGQYHSNEADTLRKAYLSGSIILLDATTSTPQAMLAASQAVDGLGLAAPIVIMRMVNHKPDYHSLNFSNIVSGKDSSPTVASYSSFLTDPRQVSALASATNAEIASVKGSSNHMRRMLSEDGASPQSNSYSPVYTYTITATAIRPSCPLHYEINAVSGSLRGDPYDYCTNASAQIIYTVDLMRSIPSTSSITTTPNAKFATISVLGENGGGAGIHISDNLPQDYSWSQPVIGFDDYIAGFVERYEFNIAPNSDSNVILFTHSPAQTNPQSQVTVTNSTVIGVSGKASAQIGSDGPTVGGEISGSFQFTNSRSVTSQNYEYTVENRSAGQQARWVWDRDSADRRCAWAVYYGTPPWCGSDTVLWEGRHIMDPSQFSAIAYKNFVPTFSATYSVDPSYTGTTEFDLNNTVVASSIDGASRFGIFALYRQVIAQDYAGFNFGMPISISWGDPVFFAEQNVILQSNDFNNLCLDVFGSGVDDGRPVDVYQCTQQKNQMWGLDTSNRYVSRVASDRCLTVVDPTHITTASCTDNNNQKWYWNGTQLLSGYVDAHGEQDYMLAINSTGSPVLVPRTNTFAKSSWSNWLESPT